MTGISVRNTLEIVLVLGLRLPKITGWFDFGDDLSRP